MTRVTAEDLELGKIELRDADGNFTLKLSQLAFDGDTNEVYLASVIGPATSVKAFRATLAGHGGRGNIRVSDYSESWRAGNLSAHREQGGYRFAQRLLGFNTWHYTALSKREEFVPNAGGNAIWNLLTGPGYSTPLIKDWMPYVLQAMKDKGYVKPLECFQCESVLVTATTEKLDAIVSEGLQSGAIKIPEG